MEFRLDIDELEAPLASSSIDSERLDSLISDEHSEDLDGKLTAVTSVQTATSTNENDPAASSVLTKSNDPAKKRTIAAPLMRKQASTVSVKATTLSKAAAPARIDSKASGPVARASAATAKPKAAATGSPSKHASSSTVATAPARTASGSGSKPTPGSPLKRSATATALSTSKAAAKAPPALLTKKAAASVAPKAAAASAADSAKRVKELEGRVHELEELVAHLQSENDALRAAAAK